MLFYIVSDTGNVLCHSIIGPPGHVWLLNTCACVHAKSLQSHLTLRPHGLKHARVLSPWLSPEVGSNSRPFSWWCHPTIASSVAPFLPALNPFPASGSFPMSWLFASGGQSIGASASSSVLPMTSLISLQSRGDSQESSPAPQFEIINSSALSLLYNPTHICTWLLEKP